MKITIEITVTHSNNKPEPITKGGPLKNAMISELPIGVIAYIVPWALYKIDGAYFISPHCTVNDSNEGTTKIAIITRGESVDIRREHIELVGRDHISTSHFDQGRGLWPVRVV